MDLDAAAVMLREDIVWRAEVRPEDINDEDVLQEIMQGSSRFLGFTSDGAIVVWNQAALWRPEELVGDCFAFFAPSLG